MLYRVATMTGIRANELASLTSGSFDLTADTPTVTIEAGYSKHRREDVLPIHPDLAARLRQWFTERERQNDDQRAVLSFNRAADAKSERLFPGTWPEKAAKMLRSDLSAAGITYLTDDGFADFHSLRHTFVSNLVTGGVHPKVAQQLARHSTITLTMDRYSHLALIDMTAGLSALPTIATTDAKECRATGTTGQASNIEDLSCTKSCNAPVQLNRFQPISATSSTAPSANKETRVSPQKTQENTGFIELHPAGLEPATFGSVDRCSIQLS